MIKIRKAKSTLTAMEVNHGDVIQFCLLNGTVTSIQLITTQAEIMHTTLGSPGSEENSATTTCKFWAAFLINGQTCKLERQVGVWQSFFVILGY